MLLIDVPGYIIWVWIWAAILLLGLAGLVGAAVWGRRTNWRNLDEVLRGLGTVSVSSGMLLLLIGRLMDEVEVVCEHGVEVRMLKRVGAGHAAA